MAIPLKKGCGAERAGEWKRSRRWATYTDIADVPFLLDHIPRKRRTLDLRRGPSSNPRTRPEKFDSATPESDGAEEAAAAALLDIGFSQESLKSEGPFVAESAPPKPSRKSAGAGAGRAVTRTTRRPQDNQQDVADMLADNEEPAEEYEQSGGGGSLMMELCRGLLRQFGTLNSDGTPRRILLDEVERLLHAKRRRLYDIMNVFESVEVVQRICKLAYEWHGFGKLPQLCAQLMQEELAGVPVDERQRKGSPQKDRESKRPSGCSMWALSRRFVRLLVVNHGQPVSLEYAADTLHDESQSRMSIERRLYDMGSILEVLGVLRKVPGRRKRDAPATGKGAKSKQPTFVWTYEFEVPTAHAAEPVPGSAPAPTPTLAAAADEQPDAAAAAAEAAAPASLPSSGSHSSAALSSSQETMRPDPEPAAAGGGGGSGGEGQGSTAASPLVQDSSPSNLPPAAGTTGTAEARADKLLAAEEPVASPQQPGTSPAGATLPPAAAPASGKAADAPAPLLELTADLAGQCRAGAAGSWPADVSLLCGMPPRAVGADAVAAAAAGGLFMPSASVLVDMVAAQAAGTGLPMGMQPYLNPMAMGIRQLSLMSRMMMSMPAAHGQAMPPHFATTLSPLHSGEGDWAIASPAMAMPSLVANGMVGSHASTTGSVYGMWQGSTPREAA